MGNLANARHPAPNRPCADRVHKPPKLKQTTEAQALEQCLKSDSISTLPMNS